MSQDPNHPPVDNVAVQQVTCQRCCRTAHVGTRPSNLAWALGELGWRTEDERHTCPDCLDLAAAEARAAADTDPVPADDAPHAYVAVKRTHSPYADRPEWGWDAAVIPVHDTDGIEHHRGRGYELLPIGPDGDTGTRAIVEPRVIKDPAELNALPGRSIVVATDSRFPEAWQLTSHNIAPSGDVANWGSPLWADERLTSRQLLTRLGTVTVLFTPEEA